MSVDIQAVNEMVREKSAFVENLFMETRKVIVGQNSMIEGMLMAFLCDGHILLEGVPGLAKTLAIHTLSSAMDLGFKRIQFTPDLLPADLTGSEIYNAKDATFSIRKGPLFGNIILADEINRAPAKVQSALLESMQERQVTIGSETFKLPDPFIVLATQNPIEQEGTYPLPEAQVDRFMLKIKVEYPTKEEEAEIVKRNTSGMRADIRPVVTADELIAAKRAIDQIYIDDRVVEYIVSVVHASRRPKDFGLDIGRLIEYGASPRASIYLTRLAKARAFLSHRGYVTPDDVKSVGPATLRHRIIPTYEAEAENVTSEDLIAQIFDTVEVP
ncbi:MoxR-like ATPase in aerotolerance operon [hydrothermal vent metagenome]|uniref:MoxR-like ATPase in aerotolerance operon n=1 Tax=hydrothermal vent metagenome TaxID=652676 RepID=A0A3B1BIV4_9ZZZZ